MNTAANAETHRWRCACCGAEMIGLPMAMAFAVPDNWLGLSEERRSASTRDDDFCLVKREDGQLERYIRCVLPLPVIETESEFHLGVWMSVSQESWLIYSSGFDTGHYETNGCFGFLGNEVRGFPNSFMLHCDVRFQPDGFRPVVILHDADHPLVDSQRDGLPISQIEEWASEMHEG